MKRHVRIAAGTVRRRPAVGVHPPRAVALRPGPPAVEVAALEVEVARRDVDGRGPRRRRRLQHGGLQPRRDAVVGWPRRSRRRPSRRAPRRPGARRAGAGRGAAPAMDAASTVSPAMASRCHPRREPCDSTAAEEAARAAGSSNTNHGTSRAAAGTTRPPRARRSRRAASSCRAARRARRPARRTAGPGASSVGLASYALLPSTSCPRSGPSSTSVAMAISAAAAAPA